MAQAARAAYGVAAVGAATAAPLSQEPNFGSEPSVRHKAHVAPQAWRWASGGGGTYRPDPEGRELRTARKYVSFEGKDVLEVGCGDGRLTFLYAAQPRRTVAIDPDREAIEDARENLPRAMARRVQFRVGGGERLAFPAASFDLVFLSWSLCCMTKPAMVKALREVWRVLRPSGTLLNLQPSLLQPFPTGLERYLVTGKEECLGGDEGDALTIAARRALRYASLVEGKFDLVAEEEFTVNDYCDTEDDVFERLATIRGKRYVRPKGRALREIRGALERARTPNGFLYRENAVLSVLRRIP